jgi:hypothetical protein
MRVSKKAIRKIDNQSTRLKLAQVIPCSETWVRVLIKKNKPNGPLTTIAAVGVITEVTGLDQSEVLEVTAPKPQRAA